MTTSIFEWIPAYREPVVLIGAATAAYCAYHYGTNAANFRRLLGNRPIPFGPVAASVMLERLGGFVLLGIVPALIGVFFLDALPWDGGLAWPDPGRLALAVLVPAVALFPILWGASRNPALRQVYPAIQLPDWSRSLVVANYVTWTLYLVAYEFFFRSFVMGSLVSWLGTWPGIAVTTALYVFVHLPKHAGEGVGAIPMGIVFGGIALWTGSVLAPILLHVYLATTTDMLAMRRGVTA